MKVKYVGAHTGGVDLALPDNSYVSVAQGGEIEVDDAHGTSLLEQVGNWEAVKPPKEPVKAQAAPDKKDGN